MGKVTIIDFWASWCGPCRAENPNVVALYNQYHNKGLNIIGVSLDDNAEQWKKAIASDELTWIHVSNLKRWKEPIALMYEVESIPCTFLLDSSGKIVGNNLSTEELETAIQSMLSTK